MASLEAESRNAAKEKSVVASFNSSLYEPSSSNQVASYFDPGKVDDRKRTFSGDSTYEKTFASKRPKRDEQIEQDE